VRPGPQGALTRLARGAALLALTLAPQLAGAGGLFVLSSARSAFDPGLLAPDYIAGVALQVGWRDVEAQEGRYEWSAIDNVVAAARRANKRVTIHLLPLHPPQWIYAAGAQPFSFTLNFPGSPFAGKEQTQVIPWDPVFLQKWEALLQRFGPRYRSEPALFAVSVTAPSPEMVLPGGIPRSESFQRLQAIYNRDVYLRAWRRMIDAYGDAFPGKPKFIAPGIVLTDEYFADDVLSYALRRYGTELWVFNAGLHAEGTAVARILRGHIHELLREYAGKSHLGFQTIWSSTQDPANRMRGPLRRALEYGAGMGAEYIEIYEVDVRNPALRDDLRYAATLLRKR
jgi:hypothetical protein